MSFHHRPTTNDNLELRTKSTAVLLLTLIGLPDDSDIVFHFINNETLPGHRIILHHTAKILVEFYQADRHDNPTIIQAMTHRLSWTYSIMLTE